MAVVEAKRKGRREHVRTVFPLAPRPGAIHHRRTPVHSPPIPCTSRARAAAGGAPTHRTQFGPSLDRWAGYTKTSDFQIPAPARTITGGPLPEPAPQRRRPTPPPKRASHQGRKRSCSRVD
jgi:hypothetical protein